MCDEEECGSIFEDILLGFGIFFLVMGFFRLLIAAVEALFVLISFLFNCILWVFYKAKLLSTKSTNRSSSHAHQNDLATYQGRIPYAQGLTAVVMIVGGLFLFMGNDASNVSANEAFREKSKVVQTEPAKVPMLKARVLASQLNARLEPHANAKILYKLKRYQIVDVYMKQDGWWLVEFNGVRAWSSAKYLSAE
ncbi:SH3 domain-containing protein [Vibrio comitans]|uniref:SH3b domain-containing protein n=1 Tax=Vibrio comitans NBRC 102076 TaxID=1219078 RepID=A0A4Y3IP10_9VIBR|nr:SH3 domain-containing protein [Vibrio comitans]GEA60997.1 hypothetical protein VCO01S_21900 [Vibrio comitans NBRC 102076]